MECTKFTGRANINLYCGDCMEAMAGMDAGRYSLGLVDPPYGLGEDSDKIREYNSKPCKSWKTCSPKIYEKKEWDKERPEKHYFNELLRVCINQIIWGGNYFADLLPPSGGWVVWDKKVGMPTFSDGELAWCSKTNSVKIARILWAGYLKCEKTNRIHPTQKPIALYKWLLTNYAKPGDTILDTHGGSMSIAIAAWDLGFDLDLYELDADYYKAGVERVKRHTAQGQFDL